jgi:two-component system chemotaxis response regulator CheY
MGFRILIVDDSVFMRNIIKNALSSSNISEIFEAGNGDEAIAAYKDKKPDLVFMDIVMPVKTGLEALKEIKGIDAAAKIVMCTSVGQEKVIEEAVNSGAYDFITKPFKAEDIKEVLTKLG